MRVRTVRKTHRYLGLVIGLQLLAWTVSGLYFAWNPLATVRGEDLSRPPVTLSDVLPAEPEGAETDQPEIVSDRLSSPSVVLAALAVEHGDVEVLGLRLRPLLGEAVYEVTFRADGGRQRALADARTGALRPELDASEAEAIARADFAADVEVLAVHRVESSEPDGEYRGKPLPAWRIDFDHESGTRIYVAAATGDITARRNDTWRVFDFLWMFHILDFEERDDFNHWLLRILSVLGVVTVLSGFALFIVTSGPVMRWRARKHRAS